MIQIQTNLTRLYLVVFLGLWLPFTVFASSQAESIKIGDTVTFQTPIGYYLTSEAILTSRLSAACSFRVEAGSTMGYRQYKLLEGNDYLIQRSDDKLFHTWGKKTYR